MFNPIRSLIHHGFSTSSDYRPIRMMSQLTLHETQTLAGSHRFRFDDNPVTLAGAGQIMHMQVDAHTSWSVVQHDSGEHVNEASGESRMQVARAVQVLGLHMELCLEFAARDRCDCYLCRHK